MSEFGEPWEEKNGTVRDSIGAFVMGEIPCIIEDAVDYIAPSPDNTDRIVACVNALAGIPTERILQLEPGAIASALDQADHGGATNLDCSYCSINQCLRLPT